MAEHAPADPCASASASASADPCPSAGLPALLAEWHALGAHRAEPVRFALVEALARRAAGQGGAARQWIDARLQVLVADLRLRLAGRGVLPAGGDGDGGGGNGSGAQAASAAAPAPPRRGALGRLADALAGPADGADGTVTHRLAEFAEPATGRRASPKPRPGQPAAPGTVTAVDAPAGTLPSTALGGGGTQAGAPRELASVQRFRGTWSRLSAHERLRQTLAQVPPQAGPLNALHLLHRALVGMQDVSPDYLQHFVAHVDALLWLEQVHAASMAAPAARSASRRKPAVRKR